MSARGGEEEQAFLAAIRAAPEQDGPRQAYGEWECAGKDARSGARAGALSPSPQR